MILTVSEVKYPINVGVVRGGLCGVSYGPHSKFQLLVLDLLDHRDLYVAVALIDIVVLFLKSCRCHRFPSLAAGSFLALSLDLEAFRIANIVFVKFIGLHGLLLFWHLFLLCGLHIGRELGILLRPG